MKKKQNKNKKIVVKPEVKPEVKPQPKPERKVIVDMAYQE